MTEMFPQVNKWATFFLYPFPFPTEKRELLPNALYDRWRLSPNFSEEKHFDEVTYFFPYVQHFLFSSLEPTERPVTHWQLAFPEQRTFTVSGYDDLALELTSVRLHIFPFDIGILSLQVQGTAPLPFERLLDFNSDFRFLTKSYKKQTLPQISLLLGEKEISETRPGREGLRPLVDYFLRELGEDSDSPLLDNRLIVYSYAALPREPVMQNTDDLFFKFLFVDKTDEHLPNAAFRQELLEGHEYKRWKCYGDSSDPESVRYGFSRYSGVVMGQEIDQDPEKDFVRGDIFLHFRTMYYDIALLLLFHRTALLRLSNGLSHIAERTTGWRRNRTVRTLRMQVLEFTNRYWFGEITNQDQGIEMFDCWKAALRNKELFDEVHTELKEYDDDLRSRNAESLSSIVAILTFVFLPLSLTATFLAVPNFTWASSIYFASSFYALSFLVFLIWQFGGLVWDKFVESIPSEVKYGRKRKS